MKYSKWLESAIHQRHIKFYSYNDFSIFEEIGDGGFGTVHRSKWKTNGLIIALKKLKDHSDEKTNERFIKELKNLQEVCDHSNIIKFYGITRDLQDRLYMVLQFANGGNLRAHLKKKFPKLEWTDKFRMGREISEGLVFLHQNKIIHLDLHSKNILVHENKMLIADFGLSKQMDDKSITSKPPGMIAYIDPQCLRMENSKVTPYRRNEKSDTYSFGVILWEISSGRPPCPTQMFKDEREKPVEGTPFSYVELYQKCWDDNPTKRPTMDQVSKKLKTLSEDPTITNYIYICNQRVARSILNESERLDSPNNSIENINMDKHEGGQNEPNDSNQGYSDDDTIEFSLLEVIQIRVKTKTIKAVDQFWNFFTMYFLNTGFLWVFQPNARDIIGCGRCGGFWLGNNKKMRIPSNYLSSITYISSKFKYL
ncbi:kinase-like domain-containing protein [Gigaspora rosea]|uniref:Kinase-like domain-containing protein n=1 Tax=Gigaspora rosea TaxID=44941 RepID=A0A397UCR7_9GLOM|nr:kinase-like domain-containing protein [Gigaspora rosea]